MRCKYCDDIIDIGAPTEEMLKIEEECPFKERNKPYEVAERIKGKEYADAYRKKREQYEIRMP
ncbi:hypothetical protein LCGC14_1620420 [marine sediment metagenome]|uniref:Uncharacterized protein n=1 Tax=marine sediment metagenome TaxID=412755 RepID=A0A0F9L5J7_9ZZZZ|nr:hypothetical protein [bacterium]